MSWTTLRDPVAALTNPSGEFKPRAYQPPPLDQTLVRVRARLRPFLLHGEVVAPGDWMLVPRWVALQVRDARGDDIEITER